MRKIFGVILFVTAFLGVSCENTGKQVDDAECESVDSLCSCPPKIVYIQPYDNESYFAGLVSELQGDIDSLMPKAGYVVEPLPVKQMPQSAYYAPRKRYRADKIIAIQKAEYKGYDDLIVIGMTRKDISTSVHGQKDYGIMGLSYNPGNSCVVSSYRVPDRRNLHKVVLHEFLHSRGLPHCRKDDPKCYMKDAKGKGNLTIQKYLCESCKKRLK